MAVNGTNGVKADLSAMATNPKFIFFTDFDGTITSSDSNDYLTDNFGMGIETRRGLNKQVLANTLTFRSAFKQMLDSIPTPFDKCTDVLLEKIALDSGFKAFYDWAKENNVPIVILSGGMTPLIRALLNKLMGEDTTMQIISNDVAARPGKTINDENGWEMKFRDERFVLSARCLTFLSHFLFGICVIILIAPQRLRTRQIHRHPPLRLPPSLPAPNHVLRRRRGFRPLCRQGDRPPFRQARTRSGYLLCRPKGSIL